MSQRLLNAIIPIWEEISGRDVLLTTHYNDLQCICHWNTSNVIKKVTIPLTLPLNTALFPGNDVVFWVRFMRQLVRDNELK